jgi:bifunctional UDP-N-acetylglucosamine pyrophosphorylase/glucosamine-1-phosphate N-acetyltransferase
MAANNDKGLSKKIKSFSGKFKKDSKNIAIILAAGHGKRIKSSTPKVIHPVWGVPSILRVCKAVSDGLKSSNQILVIGIKASAVMDIVGKNRHTVFVHQDVQNGTGHAVQVAMGALKKFPLKDANIFTFPGDMGLLDSKTVAEFERAFRKSRCDMMILPGRYDGPAEQNYYGRVIRAPFGECRGKVLKILQHKDILKMNADEPHAVSFSGTEYCFTRKELLENREFDSGIFAFRAEALAKYIKSLRPANVQKEIYLTDLVNIFVRKGLSVGAARPADSEKLLGFNNKSTLEHMESIARRNYYEILKDIISIEDDERFFMAGEVIKDILRMDRKWHVDIEIGEGCSISAGVKLNTGVVIGRDAVLEGNIRLGKNVKIGAGVRLLTYPDQLMKIGDNTEILEGNLLKGNITIGKNARIETGVHITGSYKSPAKIGDKCLIKGTTYMFGTVVEKGVTIIHSVLIEKYIRRIQKKDGTNQHIKYILPLPEGIDSIRQL